MKDCRKARRWGATRALGLGLAAATMVAGCLDRPIGPVDPRTTSVVTFKELQSRVDKIDLLLMIDNSGSMADKQNILADAVPTLVKDLLFPRCLGEDGQPIADQPPSPADKCPKGSEREFEPVLDVHIGIISSSLGGHGSAACKRDESKPETWSLDDKGHLISRIDINDPTKQGETYGGHGFIAWDPAHKLDPAGDSDIEAVVPKLREMVQGAGQSGCGYEASLESWYRFLVDPAPYATIKAVDGKAVVEGIDDVLLGQRAEFLRPDSMVAILMLSDENDCSIREDSYYYQVGNTNATLPRARQECQSDPNDRCCAPCGYGPSDCPTDAKCAAEPFLTNDEDPINLRCFDQKRRFGIDFLYPIDRYTKALTQAQITARDGTVVDNPLYPSDPTGLKNFRTPEGGLVFIAGIVGVPWQDIARKNADGNPDLVGGLDRHGAEVGGFMDADELAARDATGHSRWDVILGDPSKGVKPLDPLMIESREPRTGKNPVTGYPLAPPEAKSPHANPINGHEWYTDKGSQNGDLQYACTFDLRPADQRDCSMAQNCDCLMADTDDGHDPLCQEDNGEYSQWQRRAKAYPGVRELSLLKSVSDQAIVASGCPAQIGDESRKDYGYRPAIGALIERLKKKLVGQCLPRPLTPDAAGHVACLVLEGRALEEPKDCCEGLAGRKPVTPEHQPAVDLVLEGIVAEKAGLNCFCEIEQLSKDELHACQYDTSPAPTTANGGSVDGWCYIDATTVPSTGEPKLVSTCDPSEQRKIRFVGAGQPLDHATTFTTCSGE